MAFRKVIIFVSSSIYIIAGLWFIAGFVWMFILIFAPQAFNQLLPAFFFTISGNVLLWLGNRVSSRKDRPDKNAEIPLDVQGSPVSAVNEIPLAPGAKTPISKDIPTKICPMCNATIGADLAECPYCQYKFEEVQ